MLLFTLHENGFDEIYAHYADSVTKTYVLIVYGWVKLGVWV